MNEMWVRADETGTFRGQCAELCGKDHGYMPIVVDVVSEDEFQAWLAEKRKQG
jgi:cytochrome c oxidase subunit 2